MVYHLSTPLEEGDVRRLRVGDVVELSGIVITARDEAHKYLADGGDYHHDLNGAVIYHCGPVIVKQDGVWRVTAAGPTTSIREEPYMARLMQALGIRAVIGKGGMGEDTLAACQRCGCAYLHAVGGLAQVLANRITKVLDVDFLEEFGAPEAMWRLEVSRFPVMVTMDAHGNSLHSVVRERSQKNLRRCLSV